MKIYNENALMLSDSTRFSNNQGLLWRGLYSCDAENSITSYLSISERKYKKHLPTAVVTTRAK